MSVRRERSDLLSKQCQDLTALSNGLIGARLGRGTEFDSLLQRFKTAISGSGLRTNKIDAVFDRVKAAEDTLGAWEEMTEELERVLLASDDASAKQWTPRSALAALSAAELERIRPKLTLEDVLEMSLSGLAIARPSNIGSAKANTFHLRLLQQDSRRPHFSGSCSISPGRLWSSTSPKTTWTASPS
jgi:hypothetical protein